MWTVSHPQARAVVLATASNFPDALAGRVEDDVDAALR